MSEQKKVMLCERCQKEVAVVHITRINADCGTTVKHDFRFACAQEEEGEMIPPGLMKAGWTSYGGSEPDAVKRGG